MRKSLKSIKQRTSIECNCVYPIIGTNKLLSNLKSVGIKLTSDQAIDLATAILLAANNWSEIEVTCWRSNNQITITTSKDITKTDITH